MPLQLFKYFTLVFLLFLAFLGGILSAINKTYFYRKVEEVRIYQQAENVENFLKTHSKMQGFYTETSGKKGVTRYDAAQSYGDLTFYSDASQNAYLIDMKGNIVHSWHFPIEEILPDHKGRKAICSYSRLFPNGDIMTIYELHNEEPYGAALIKLDKDSNLIWQYDEHAHHMIDIAPDNTIYVPIHTIDKEPFMDIRSINTVFMHEYIAVVHPNGGEIKRISILHALYDSPYRHFLDRLPHERGDLTHINSVQYITPELSTAFPKAHPGDLLISIRNLDAIVLLDPQTERITWLKTSTWIAQHDATLLPNGHIMLFDNMGMLNEPSHSRVIEYDPQADTIVWSYSGTEADPLINLTRGSQQPLPNGNLLISATTKGRLLEVNRKGDIVWEYYGLLRQGKADEYIGMVNWGARYRFEDLPFLY